MLRTCSSMACSAARDWRSMRSPNTISKAIENSSSPPAMRNAGSEIPSVRSSQSPANAAPNRIAAAISEARNATWRRCCGDSPSVTARKVGASPTGSTTTSSVTSAEIRNSSGIGSASRPAGCRGANDLPPVNHKTPAFAAVSGSIPGSALHSWPFRIVLRRVGGKLPFAAADSCSRALVCFGAPRPSRRSFTLTLQPNTIPAGTENTPYSQMITAVGGNAPYTFAVTAGSLPVGITLDPGGLLSGTPTTPNALQLHHRGDRQRRQHRLPALYFQHRHPGRPDHQSGALPDGTQGVAYSQTVTASGGSGGYTSIRSAPARCRPAFRSIPAPARSPARRPPAARSNFTRSRDRQQRQHRHAAPTRSTSASCSLIVNPRDPAERHAAARPTARP